MAACLPGFSDLHEKRRRCLFWSLTEYLTARREHELINREKAEYWGSANPASKHNFRTLADNAEPLCLMSAKQLFYCDSTLMACYLFHPLITFSFLPDAVMTRGIPPREPVFPHLGSCFGIWDLALCGRARWKARYRQILPGGWAASPTPAPCPREKRQRWQDAPCREDTSTSNRVCSGSWSWVWLQGSFCCYSEGSGRLSTNRAVTTFKVFLLYFFPILFKLSW